MFELILVLLAIVGLTHLIVDSTIFNRYIRTPLHNYLYLKEKRYPEGEEQFVLDDKGEKILKKQSWFRRRLVEADEMMSCYQCSGFWSGIAVGSIWLVCTLDSMRWLRVLLYAFAGSYLTMLGAILLTFFNNAGSNNVEDRHG